MMFCAVEQGFGRVVRLRRGQRGHGQQGHLTRVCHAARGGGRRGSRPRGAAGGWLLTDDVRRGHGMVRLDNGGGGGSVAGKGTKGVKLAAPDGTRNKN